MPYRKTVQFRIDSIAGLLLMVLFFIGIFFVLRGLFWVLSWVAPVLLIAAFIIDRSVVINYGKWLIRTVKNNPLLGIAAIVFTVIGYAVVFPLLFAKAFFKKKIKTATQQYESQQQGEFVDFEELDGASSQEKPLELPPLKKKEQQGEYDQLFN
ncbi:MAG: hypothetical protein EPO28_15860 [Saprospiraceae bacterium]|nr:MAG: hypothetical protein EPO28_15860 [Saprospiraceae bacterium]